MRAERDGLERAITQLTQGRAEVRNEPAERELNAPGAWVRDTFGERPHGSWLGDVWENGVRKVARYRLQYDISAPKDALGPRPEQREQQHDWDLARHDRSLFRDQHPDDLPNLQPHDSQARGHPAAGTRRAVPDS
jgi:hypothetical protein